MPDLAKPETANAAATVRTRRGVAPAVLLLALVGVTSLTGLWMSGRGPFAPAGHSAAVQASVSATTTQQGTHEDVAGVPGVHTSSTDAAPQVTPTDATSDHELSPEDAERARLIVGVWEQERFGKRQMTVKSDGTATMIMRPSGVWSTMFGERIDLEMYWSIRNGHIDYGVSGGTPAQQTETARKMWGDHWVEKIEKLSSDEMVLLDQSTSAPSGWKRVVEKVTPPTE
jgi:hypothetical protein